MVISDDFQIELRSRFSRGLIRLRRRIVSQTLSKDMMLIFHVYLVANMVPCFPVPTVLTAAQNNIANEAQSIQQLAQVASKHPYYRFNYAWSRQVESAVWLIS